MTEKSKKFWIGIIITAIFAAIGVAATLFVPEVRLFLGIEKKGENVNNQLEVKRIQEQIEEQMKGKDDRGYFQLDILGIAIAKNDVNNGAKLKLEDATNLCKNSILGGYRDWRLPTLDELTTIYHIKNIIGGFSKDNYWSSTSDKYSDKKAIHMEKGTTTNSYSYHEYRCRCVRTILNLEIAEEKVE